MTGQPSTPDEQHPQEGDTTPIPPVPGPDQSAGYPFDQTAAFAAQAHAAYQPTYPPGVPAPPEPRPMPATDPYGHPYAQSAYPYAAHLPVQRRTSRRRGLLKVGAGATALVTACALAFAVGTTRSHTVVQRVPSASGGSVSNPFGQFPFGTYGDGSGTGSSGSSGSGGFGFGDGSGSSSSSTTAKATTAQMQGVVDIDTNLKYEEAEAAGTGMILDSSGDVLTNNHVVDGSTSIKVTIVSTGKTYTASVVGTDPTQDIAVIHLTGASGLTTANFGDSSSVKVGDAVTGVGNAGGTGGTPSAASGKVLALNQSITAADDGGGNAEKLPNVIVSDAPIQAGDSGGPLYNSKNQIVGIDTAANTSGTAEGFSIPINTALNLAHEIESGVQTTSIHIGLPGFLGISVDPESSGTGALVAGLLSGGPAAKAGIVAGDRITAIGSTKTSTADKLTTVMESLDPGDRVSVTYTTSSGATHHATVTLATGPAD